MSNTERDELKAEVTELLKTVSIVGLRRIKAGIEKRRHQSPRTSDCKPKREPLANWKPKHEHLTKKALELIQTGVGVKAAPFHVGPNGWTCKFFASDIAERLVYDVLHDENGAPLEEDKRSKTATSSITVATLTARIVEEANALQTIDPLQFGDAKLQMQGSREDAGWSKATTRGSGVVMNDLGKELFAAAAEQLKTRLGAAC